MYGMMDGHEIVGKVTSFIFMLALALCVHDHLNPDHNCKTWHTVKLYCAVGTVTGLGEISNWRREPCLLETTAKVQTVKATPTKRPEIQAFLLDFLGFGFGQLPSSCTKARTACKSVRSSWALQKIQAFAVSSQPAKPSGQKSRESMLVKTLVLKGHSQNKMIIVLSPNPIPAILLEA